VNNTTDRLNEMLVMQDEMNRIVHPEWQDQNFPWYRAAMVESIELLEHYGFKWWKKQDPDMKQVQLEVVDIWHFMLSSMVEAYGTDKATQILSESIDEFYTNELDSPQNLRDTIDKFVGLLCLNKAFDIPTFLMLMKLSGLSFEALYLQYIGKNTLNRFRQENGYKDGTYIKVWNNREDNEVLFELLERVKPEDNAADVIYNGLTAQYADIK
jgi:dimeric dUTPase (all-alpha-NTP-PPase superfamily)